MTRQRRLIEEILSSSQGHLTADEIFLEAKKRSSTIAFGTVYRNLKQMSESGVIRRVPMPDGPDFYDRRVCPHEHLFCRSCRKLTDLPPCDLREYLKEKTGLEIDSYVLTLRYVCPACRKAQIQHPK